MQYRLTYIDNLRAVCLVLMVAGHTGLTLAEKNLIYSFHIPLFYFLAGLLYRGFPSSPLRHLGRKALRLLVPYVLFTLAVYAVAYLALGRHGGPRLLLDTLLLGEGLQGGGAALWFLPALFCTYASALLLRAVRLPWWLIGVAAAGGWYAQSALGVPTWLGFRASGLFFFTIGMGVRSLLFRLGWGIDQHTAPPRTAFRLTLAVLLAVYAVALPWGGFPGQQVFNIIYMPLHPGMLVAALAACPALLLLFRAWRAPHAVERVCAWVSRHAVLIIGTHFVPILFLKQFHLASHLPHAAHILLIMVAEAVWLAMVVPLLARLCPLLEGCLPALATIRRKSS